MTGLRSPSNQCKIKFDPINPAPPVTRIGLSIRTEALSRRYLRPFVAYARRQDLQKLDCNRKGGMPDPARIRTHTGCYPVFRRESNPMLVDSAAFRWFQKP